MKDMNVIKNDYINAASIHADATYSGDYKLGNKQVNKIIKLYKILKDTEEGRNILKELLHHSNPGVQLWAASHSLPFCTKEAIKVLKKVQENNDLIGFSAGLR